ncbi:SEFIR domain-containing protein [Aquirufa nivalisilvae]
MEKEIFVTYSWDSPEHKGEVISFTDLLRKEGFNAEMDLMLAQNESVLDLSRMMHNAMTDYEKVIVVLSEGYKEKAERFEGGVGREYKMILNDIDENTNKYILISFGPIRKEIMPLGFKGRFVLDVSIDSNMNILYAKLKNENVLEFSEVGSKKPEIIKTAIKDYDFKQDNLEIGNLEFRSGNTMLLALKITKIDYSLSLEVINNSSEIISDYSIEVSYPQNSISFESNRRIENGCAVITYEGLPKIFPSQKTHIILEKIIITNRIAEEILDKFISVKIYTGKGMVDKTFPLKETIPYMDGSNKTMLSLDLFLDKYS